MARTRRLVNKYVEDQVMVFCQQYSSLPKLKLEYTGSVYERLKTEAADEVDVMVGFENEKERDWGYWIRNI